MTYKTLVSFLGVSILGLILLVNVVANEDRGVNNTPYTIGVIADCQYCSDPGKGVRKYAASEEKLKQCVSHFNSMNLEYVVHLGDFIDRDFESFDVVGPIYKELKAPKYHVLGNHDFFVADELKKDVPKTMGLSSRYYDFKINDWRFIVLDGNDISFHGHSENSKEYKESEIYYEEHQLTSPKWNGAISEKQLKWINKVLEKSDKLGEKAVLYCHFPVYPADSIHNLWNSLEVIEVLEKHPNVVAYINGHNHAGNYAKKDGIHYLTMKGMVDTEETSYAVIEVLEDQLKIDGFGREEDRVLEYTK